VDETAPSAFGDCVRLSCVDDDAQGDVLEVVWQAELDAQILDFEGWSQIGAKGFDEPRLFAAYFNTLRWHCVTATDPKLFQAPFRAGNSPGCLPARATQKGAPTPSGQPVHRR